MVGDILSGAEFAPFRLCLVPAWPLPLAGDGPVCSWLALLWYWLSPLFCVWPSSVLGQGFLQDSARARSLSLSLAIPQIRLLSHISSLRLRSGHSGPALTLSNAVCFSPFSPCLLVADASVWGTSLLEVAFRHVICGFYLFIFPPGYVAFRDLKTFPPQVRGFPCVWKLLLY